MKYEVIATGSNGNAVVINDNILIDCGVSFKALSEVYKGLSLVIISHAHIDHFIKTTVRKLASERPMLRFACGDWLVADLVGCGVGKDKIDVIKPDVLYNYGSFKIQPVALVHNVQNLGFKIIIGEEKLFYATDTGNLDGITAPGYALYLVECNYEDEEMQERIQAKQEAGEYIYEYDAMKNHLSKQQVDEFILSNMGENSEYVYLHQHRG